jgi:uncharacterized protein YdbL (DUF1318 family)
MNTRFLSRALWCWFALWLGAAALHASDSLDAVKARMEKRVAAINKFKDRKIVGENNRGFLDVRGEVLGEERGVVSEENSDRQKVYAAIAAQERTTVDNVGRQRAQQLESLAKRGHWVQDEDGRWYQKN